MSDDFDEESFASRFVGPGGSINIGGMVRALFYTGISTVVFGILDTWLSIVGMVRGVLSYFMDEYVSVIWDAFGVPRAVLHAAAEETASFLDLLGVAAFPVALVIGILVLTIMNEVYSSVLG